MSHCLGCGAWTNEDPHEENCPMITNDIPFLMMVQEMDNMFGQGESHLSPSNKNALAWAMGDRSLDLCERMAYAEDNLFNVRQMISSWDIPTLTLVQADDGLE